MLNDAEIRNTLASMLDTWDQMSPEARADALRKAANRAAEAERHAALDEAFDRVKPASHWKDAIRRDVTVTTGAELRLIGDAVEYFTATRASFHTLRVNPNGTMVVRVKAAGYRAGPAGDH